MIEITRIQIKKIKPINQLLNLKLDLLNFVSNLQFSVMIMGIITYASVFIYYKTKLKQGLYFLNYLFIS
ncbi:MAG: hypothetical protein COW67_06430 [Flavobacteriales bacterium CG18_big_fil_WC_8_21_14_2_50_32_9]|nr:MAG: hypothetical protein COW67_06430 [Flavobacteriales bacterium CG18_big_fil_WC_8_21_14_2_50_32_9]PJC61686.1 MAG: hypothetical protein CO022_08500 [Flavobacteriales bacterium CG_4_9_14_0_2_um_filter_32_27]